MSIVDTVSKAVDTVTGLVGTANGLLAKASSVANASIESVVSSLPISSGAFTQITSAVQSVSSIAGIVGEGTSQALSKVKQLIGGTGEALSNPISFVTKTLKDTVDGFSSSKDIGGAISDSIKGISSGTLSSFASRAGVEGISSASELSNALVTISDNIYLGAYTATSLIQNTENTIVATTMGLSNTIREGIKGNIKLAALSAAGTVSVVNEAVAKATNNASLLVNSGLSQTLHLIKTTNTLLPNHLQEKITYLDAATTAVQTAQIATRLTNNLSTIAAEIDYSPDVSDSYKKVMDITGTTYPRFTDTLGNVVPGITNEVSTLSKTEIKKLTNTIKKVCPTANIPEVTNYDEMKALYDTALDIACKNGMAVLVSSMCQTNLYFDKRSIVVLKSHLSSVLKTGDIALYTTLVNILGPGVIANPISDLQILAANMSMNDVNLNYYNDLLTKLNITVDKLVSQNTYNGISAIDTNSVALLAATDTTVVDGIVGKDTRNMALQFKVAYSK